MKKTTKAVGELLGIKKVIPQIRVYDSGGKRDTNVGKLDFEGFLSPRVLIAFAEYMNKNRTMADGSIRSSDNWQKGFGDKHYDVCMQSMFRHFMDVWTEHREGFTEEGQMTALMGLLFNVQAYAHQLLKDIEETV